MFDFENIQLGIESLIHKYFLIYIQLMKGQSKPKVRVVSVRKIGTNQKIPIEEFRKSMQNSPAMKTGRLERCNTMYNDDSIFQQSFTSRNSEKQDLNKSQSFSQNLANQYKSVPIKALAKNNPSQFGQNKFFKKNIESQAVKKQNQNVLQQQKKQLIQKETEATTIPVRKIKNQICETVFQQRIPISLSTMSRWLEYLENGQFHQMVQSINQALKDSQDEQLLKKSKKTMENLSSKVDFMQDFDRILSKNKFKSLNYAIQAENFDFFSYIRAILDKLVKLFCQKMEIKDQKLTKLKSKQVENEDRQLFQKLSKIMEKKVMIQSQDLIALNKKLESKEFEIKLLKKQFLDQIKQDQQDQKQTVEVVLASNSDLINKIKQLERQKGQQKLPSISKIQYQKLHQQNKKLLKNDQQNQFNITKLKQQLQIQVQNRQKAQKQTAELSTELNRQEVEFHQLQKSLQSQQTCLMKIIQQQMQQICEKKLQISRQQLQTSNRYVLKFIESQKKCTLLQGKVKEFETNHAQKDKNKPK